MLTFFESSSWILFISPSATSNAPVSMEVLWVRLYGETIARQEGEVDDWKYFYVNM
jgi:hypothetical protein